MLVKGLWEYFERRRNRLGGEAFSIRGMEPRPLMSNQLNHCVDWMCILRSALVVTRPCRSFSMALTAALLPYLW